MGTTIAAGATSREVLVGSLGRDVGLIRRG